jgi:hypothetical protein
MRITIGIKIFGIAVGLLILMAVVALLSMRMTRTARPIFLEPPRSNQWQNPQTLQRLLSPQTI